MRIENFQRENWFCRNLGGFTGILKKFGVERKKCV
jgi:hypothetical protein